MTDRKRHPARAGEIFFGVVLRMAYHRFRGKWFDYERPEERDLNGSLGGLLTAGGQFSAWYRHPWHCIVPIKWKGTTRTDTP